MAGLVEVNLDDVFDGLDSMVKAGKDLRPVWKAVRGGLRKDLQGHFASRSGPEGPWAPPAHSTIERLLSVGGRKKNVTRKGTLKRRAARRLANQLGRLKSWWKITFTPGSLTAASGADWSDVHNTGGTAGRGARIPQRTFAWVTDGFVGAVTEAVLLHLERVW
jgi:hypothetical protein